MSDLTVDWTAALADSGWSRRELWLACFALGANSSPAELDRYLAGQDQPTVTEHNVIAQALNERLHDLGYDRPLAYRDPSPPPPS